MNLHKTVLMAVFVVLTGCVAMTATYTKPTHVASKDNYTLVIDKDFDQVWSQLIEYSASTFFSIDNFEKNSGLMTLSFGASMASEFITGGHWESEGVAFDGEYVDFLTIHHGGSLNGKMNIVVTKLAPQKTRITVNARYIFSTPQRPYSRSKTWAFDTGHCATIQNDNAASGTSPDRTLCPTYKAENSILNAVK